MEISKTSVVTEGQFLQKNLPELGDLELLVAPWENAAFRRRLQLKLQALPREQRAGGTIDPATFDRCTAEAIPGTVLFGWNNFSHDGKSVEFSIKVAQDYLTDPQFRVLFDGVVTAAKRAQDGVVADAEAIEKN